MRPHHQRLTRMTRSQEFRFGFLVEIALFAIAILCPGHTMAAPSLGPIFGDGMVIQRDRPIAVIGKALPNEALRGSIGDAQASTFADAAGNFVLRFPALAESTKGIDIQISTGTETLRVRDVAVGDVFLCSGQSNMEFPVKNALNAWNELQSVDDPLMRLFTVPKETAPLVQERFVRPSEWRAADSASAADFSAACYYMGKQLRRDHPEVPVGLINASWGGSAASAWLDPRGVTEEYGTQASDLLSLYARDPRAAAQSFAPHWFDWYRDKDNGREPWIDATSLEWQTVPRISFWNAWAGSGLDNDPAANVWLRKTFTLTSDQAAQAAQLSIGALDDLDLTWVNGHVVGYTFGWGVERHYAVPPEFLHAGENEILIAVTNLWDTGGFYGQADRLYITPATSPPIMLGDNWTYSVSPVKEIPPRAPWDANAGLGVMHNAMIAPLGAVQLAGVAWYQGESDVGHGGYDRKLDLLISGWRRQFGDETRVVIVQLANFGQRRSQPSNSDWAQLRQEQLQSVESATNAVLVTAIDLGEASDIHPANKNELGKRLAMAFEGKPMPMPLEARAVGTNVVVRFSGIEGALRAVGGSSPLGVELCGRGEGSCQFAEAKLVGDTMIIPHEGNAAFVRYAWSDSPITNLFDAREVAIPSFELRIIQ